MASARASASGMRGGVSGNSRGARRTAGCSSFLPAAFGTWSAARPRARACPILLPLDLAISAETTPPSAVIVNFTRTVPNSPTPLGFVLRSVSTTLRPYSRTAPTLAATGALVLAVARRIAERCPAAAGRGGRLLLALLLHFLRHLENCLGSADRLLQRLLVPRLLLRLPLLALLGGSVRLLVGDPVGGLHDIGGRGHIRLRQIRLPRVEKVGADDRHTDGVDELPAAACLVDFAGESVEHRHMRHQRQAQRRCPYPLVRRHRGKGCPKRCRQRRGLRRRRDGGTRWMGNVDREILHARTTSRVGVREM